MYSLIAFFLNIMLLKFTHITVSSCGTFSFTPGSISACEYTMVYFSFSHLNFLLIIDFINLFLLL